MKKSTLVASVISDLELPVRELENSANKYSHSRSRFDDNIKGSKKVSWRFLSATVTGTIQIVFGDRSDIEFICVERPSIAHFFVACTKKEFSEKFEFEFANSLS